MLRTFRIAATALLFASTGCAEVAARRPMAFAPAPAQFVPEVEGHIQRIEARLRLAERMASYRVPAVSVAVVNRGVVEWARGYGVLEAGRGARVTHETLFQAASVSKPVTTVAAMRLVQDRRVGLDDDVNQWLRSWKVPENQYTAQQRVTLRHLLSHSAGIGVHGFRGYAEGEPIPTLLDVLDGHRPCNSPAIRVGAVPGQRFKYSGGGFTVVQQLLIDATGEPFPDLMRDIVLDPLGMTHSTYEQPLPGAFASHAASGHRTDGAPIGGGWFTYPEMGAAGLWTTPTDLARVVVELQTAAGGGQSRVLSPQTAKLMLSSQQGSQAIGIGVHGNGSGARFSHGGVNQGFRSTLVGLIHTGQGAVVMSNSDAGGKLNDEIVATIAAEYGWPDEQSGRPARGHDTDELSELDPEGEPDAVIASLAEP